MATTRTPERRNRSGPVFVLILVSLVVLAIEALFFSMSLPWTIILFLVVVLVAGFLFLTKPFAAVLTLFAIKPLLDIMWSASFGGLKGTYVIAVSAVILWLVGMLYFKVNPLAYPNGRIMLFWGVITLLPFVFSLFTNIYLGIIGGLSTSLRYINGWGFYFLVAFLIKKRSDASALVNAWLISAGFAAATGLFYLITGDPAGFQHTLGWDRLQGPYHDAAAFMIEIGPGLPMLFYKIYKANKTWKKLIWFGLLAVWFVLAFKSYTRAWWIASAVITLLWAWVGLYQPVLALPFAAAWKWKEVFRRFTTSGIEDLSSGAAFGGRMRLWERFFGRFWTHLSPLEKVVGAWPGVRGFVWIPDYHNQYMLITAHMGLLGLLAYLGMLGGFVFSLIKKVFSNRRPEALLGLSVLIIILLTGFSGRIMEVPNAQWLFFSVMGLCFSPGLSESG